MTFVGLSLDCDYCWPVFTFKFIYCLCSAFCLCYWYALHAVSLHLASVYFSAWWRFTSLASCFIAWNSGNNRSHHCNGPVKLFSKVIALCFGQKDQKKIHMAEVIRSILPLTVWKGILKLKKYFPKPCRGFLLQKTVKKQQNTTTISQIL